MNDVTFKAMGRVTAVYVNGNMAGIVIRHGKKQWESVAKDAHETVMHETRKQAIEALTK